VLDPETVGAYVEGSLDGVASSRVEAHIDVCADCRRYVSELARSSVDDADLASTLSPVAAERGARLARGTPVGRYVVEAPIGAGAMGAVYAAHDPELHRKVALKMVRGEFTEDEQSQNRLLREAQAMARLSHPNVVTVYDLVLDGHRLFIAMELIDGVSLATWLRANASGWRKVAASTCDTA